jgi:hypothetical protein
VRRPLFSGTVWYAVMRIRITETAASVDQLLALISVCIAAACAASF